MPEKQLSNRRTNSGNSNQHLYPDLKMNESLSINTSSSSFYALPSRLNSFSDKELLKSAANRMLHSKEYKILYLVLAVVSFMCLVVSLVVSCPSSVFYIAEGVVLFFMIIEFLIRYVAIGKAYFKSLFNIADVGVIALCVIVFCLLLTRSCSQEASTEAVIEDVLLVARNGIQLTRLVMMLQKYGSYFTF
jgi:hypothetical protein